MGRGAGNGGPGGLGTAVSGGWGPGPGSPRRVGFLERRYRTAYETYRRKRQQLVQLEPALLEDIAQDPVAAVGGGPFI